MWTVTWTVSASQFQPGGTGWKHFNTEAEANAWTKKWLHSGYEIKPRVRKGWVNGQFVTL